MTQVVLIRDPADAIAGSAPVRRAIERLRLAFLDRGIGAEGRTATDGLAREAIAITISGPTARTCRRAQWRAHADLPAVPEAFAIVAEGGLPQRLTACAADIRGLVYAVLELADRVEHADDPLAAVRQDRLLVERPANAVRSVTRLFCSDVEDLAWYRDESFWRRYLAMLVAQRFNRFSLTLGLGYNFPRGITDGYLYFPYPFLISVPGYGVRVPQVSDEERERNLAALRFASEEAAAFGLDFQLGLWTHAYEWLDSPHAHQTVEGLTPDTHAPYCRDAVRELLQLCPAISGLTFRIHGESGVPEGSWDFWKTVFDGIRQAERPVGIDLHAKGLDGRTLRAALETGQQVTVSPKLWAEHMGLPYHQAAIRELERPPRGDPSERSDWHRYMAVSEGSRPFTRYGFADFLREDRPYDVVFRLWAGTQRLLLWGDPAFAAGYGRISGLAGAKGLEWCEPVTFKGREGSGIAGSRTAYADTSLIPRDDWEKYSYSYRLFGRLGYDPGAAPESWRRPLLAAFGDNAEDAEASLANASRILPLVTTAHHPSASNNYYWPETYTDMPIVWTDSGTRPHPYIDTPVPRRFGTVSPLDPEVFSSIAEYVQELLTGESSGRIPPIEVAARLERLAADSGRHLAAIHARTPDVHPHLRRWVVDAQILAELGRFFAGKLRAAVHYEVHTATGDPVELREAVRAYRAARRAWAAVVAQSRGVYAADLTFGAEARLRGHWADRLEAIEADLHDMEGRLAAATSGSASRQPRLAAQPSVPAVVVVVHEPPRSFRRGETLRIGVALRGEGATSVSAVTLRYRPMNQALQFRVCRMIRTGHRFEGHVGEPDTAGFYPLTYAFVLRDETGRAWRHPGLGADLCGQPYYLTEPEPARRAKPPQDSRKATVTSDIYTRI
jgi:hypothetical protein